MLSRLETKIPPPIVMLLCAALAWALADVLPGRPLEWPFQGALAGLLVVAGLFLNLAPKRAFQRAGTTVNPMTPASATTLVTTGLYRWSRNPMYLGQAVLLTAWALFIDRPAAFGAVPLFVAYITRLQIVPEEDILHRRFPGIYVAFRERTRRWL
jgi:protein-S-isoprenylcysteine O-methyltransferase Ste14